MTSTRSPIRAAAPWKDFPRHVHADTKEIDTAIQYAGGERCALDTPYKCRPQIPKRIDTRTRPYVSTIMVAFRLQNLVGHLHDLTLFISRYFIPSYFCEADNHQY